MAGTRCAASMQLIEIARNSQGPKRSQNIASRGHCTVRATSAIWKSSSKHAVVGSLRALSERKPWPTTLLPKLTGTSGDEGSGELRLAVGSGPAFGHAGPEVFWARGIPRSLGRQARARPTKSPQKMFTPQQGLLATCLRSQSQASYWTCWS